MLSKEKTLLRLPCHLQKFIEWKRNSSLTLQTTLTVCATHKTAYCCSTSIPSKVGRDVKSQPRNPAQQTNPGNYCPRLPLSPGILAPIPGLALDSGFVHGTIRHVLSSFPRSLPRYGTHTPDLVTCLEQTSNGLRRRRCWGNRV